MSNTFNQSNAALGKFDYFAEAIKENNRILIVLRHRTQKHVYCDFYLILGGDREQNVDRYTFESSNVLGIPYDASREALKIQRDGRSLPDLFRERLASAGIASPVSIQVI